MPALQRAKAGGIGQYFDGPSWQGKLTETHASTCAHCAHITEYPSQRSMMEYVDFCRGCMKLICLGCYGHPCRPQEKEAERLEAEARLHQRIEQSAWRCY